MSIYRRVLRYYRPYLRANDFRFASLGSRHRTESAQALAIQVYRRSHSASRSISRRNNARLSIPIPRNRLLPSPESTRGSRRFMSRARRNSTALGDSQFHHELPFREGWTPGAAEIAHRSLRVSAIALAQISRRATLERFEFSRRLRFAVDPDDLQQRLHEHFRLGHHAHRHFCHHDAARLATDACSR